jgi:hypothetical protein
VVVGGEDAGGEGARPVEDNDLRSGGRFKFSRGFLNMRESCTRNGTGVTLVVLRLSKSFNRVRLKWKWKRQVTRASMTLQ